MDKLQIKQASGKPAVKYSDIEPGVVFTFNDGSIYSNASCLRVTEGHIHLGLIYGFTRISSKLGEALCTVYISTLTMEV